MNVKFSFKGLRFNVGDDRSKLYPLLDISKNAKFPFILDQKLTDQVKITVDNIQFKFGVDFQIPLMEISFYDDLGYIINNYMPYMTNQHIIFDLTLSSDKVGEDPRTIFTYVGYIEDDPCELEDNGKGTHKLIIRPHYHSPLTAPSPARSFKNKTSSDIIKEILTSTPYNIPEDNLSLDVIDNRGDWIKVNGESDIDFINRTLSTPYNTRDTNYIYKFWIDMNDKVFLKSMEKEINNYTGKNTDDGDIVFKYPIVDKTKFVASSLEFKSLGITKLSSYNNTKKFTDYAQGRSIDTNIYADSLPVQDTIGKMSPYENDLKYAPMLHKHDMLPSGMNYGTALKNKESVFPYVIALDQLDDYIEDLHNGKMYTVRTQNNMVQSDIPSLLSGGWLLFNTIFEIDSDETSTPFTQTIVMKKRTIK